MPTIKRIKRKRGGVAFQIAYYWQGKRRWLSLPSFFNKRDAQELALVVAKIIDARKAGRELDPRTVHWLELAPPIIRSKLDALELVQAKQQTTLGELIDAYEENELDNVKESTQRTKRSILDWIRSYFPDELDVATLTASDAAKFFAFLSERRAASSCAAAMKELKRLLNWGVSCGLLEKNPIKGAPIGSYKNKDREVYITLENFRQVLAACPSQAWRALLSFYRFGGLRVAEALAVRWEDIDWERGRFTVRSEKTERFDKDRREVPLFPELRAELERLGKKETSGTLFQFARGSLRAEMLRILKRAGLDPWPRLFQNLRSSRAVELSQAFGDVVEAAWLGHTPKTAREHYLHATDFDYERATTETTTISGAKRREK